MNLIDFSKLKFGLAPMAGYTDAAFRLLCKEYGADFGITELISAESMVRGNKQGFELAQTSDEERPIGIQLFGSNPKSIASAAAMLEKDADFIDLNFGCPAQKVIRGLGGAALLARPDRLKEIVDAVVSTIKKPVTAKMRLGINNADRAVEIAKIVERAGTSALFVHARTLKQGYSGEPDWSKIKEIKNALAIPVFGNGNVRSYADARKMLDSTNCDGVLIGRAALGNPLIFQACRKKQDFEACWDERRSTFMHYLELRKKLKMRESVGMIKGQAIVFTQGTKNARQLREKISKTKTIEEIISVFA